MGVYWEKFINPSQVSNWHYSRVTLYQFAYMCLRLASFRQVLFAISNWVARGEWGALPWCGDQATWARPMASGPRAQAPRSAAALPRAGRALRTAAARPPRCCHRLRARRTSDPPRCSLSTTRRAAFTAKASRRNMFTCSPPNSY